jgi:hypothetical protein
MTQAWSSNQVRPPMRFDTRVDLLTSAGWTPSQVRLSTEVTEQEIIASLRAELADARNISKTYRAELQTAHGKIAQLKQDLDAAHRQSAELREAAKLDKVSMYKWA